MDSSSGSSLTGILDALDASLHDLREQRRAFSDFTRAVAAAAASPPPARSRASSVRNAAQEQQHEPGEAPFEAVEAPTATQSRRLQARPYDPAGSSAARVEYADPVLLGAVTRGHESRPTLAPLSPRVGAALPATSRVFSPARTRGVEAARVRPAPPAVPFPAVFRSDSSPDDSLSRSSSVYAPAPAASAPATPAGRVLADMVSPPRYTHSAARPATAPAPIAAAQRAVSRPDHGAASLDAVMGRVASHRRDPTWDAPMHDAVHTLTRTCDAINRACARLTRVADGIHVDAAPKQQRNDPPPARDVDDDADDARVRCVRLEGALKEQRWIAAVQVAQMQQCVHSLETAASALAQGSPPPQHVPWGVARHTHARATSRDAKRAADAQRLQVAKQALDTALGALRRIDTVAPAPS